MYAKFCVICLMSVINFILYIKIENQDFITLYDTNKKLRK